VSNLRPCPNFTVEAFTIKRKTKSDKERKALTHDIMMLAVQVRWVNRAVALAFKLAMTCD